MRLRSTILATGLALGSALAGAGALHLATPPRAPEWPRLGATSFVAADGRPCLTVSMELRGEIEVEFLCARTAGRR